MKIDIPDHRMREIAETVAYRRSRRNRAQSDGAFLAMGEHEQFLAGVALLTDCLGSHQRKAFEAMVDAAMLDRDNG